MLLADLQADLIELDRRIASLDHEIQAIAQSDSAAKRLQQLRGVGPIIATALVAAVGNGQQFKNGREMSAALGLTPRQHSSGFRDKGKRIANLVLGGLSFALALVMVLASQG